MRAVIAFGILALLLGSSVAGDQQCGTASWYSLPGQATASGEPMNPGAMTAAHKSLPLGTVVDVQNMKTGKSVTVTINDRGPYIAGRIIDLSHAAGRKLGIIPAGTAPVCVRRVR